MYSDKEAIKALLSIPVVVKVWQLTTSYIVAFLTAFFIGLVVFGWWLWPVQWEPSKMNTASYYSQVTYVHLVSEWYAFTQNDQMVTTYLEELDKADEIACSLADGEAHDLGRKARYIKVAYLKNGTGCK